MLKIFPLLLLALSSSEAKNLQLTLYYESLCPDCHNFINQQLFPTWQLLTRFLDLVFIPYGNARDIFNTTSSKWETNCQHGPNECLGNIMGACAIDQAPNDQDKIINFIHCLSQGYDPASVVEQCAGDSKLDFAKLTSCYEGPRGIELQFEYGNITRALTPPLRWVPTVAINGVFDEDQQDALTTNLTKTLCKILQEKATEPIPECKAKSRMILTNSPIV